MDNRDLTKGSVLGTMVRFALPYMLAYFLQILYGLADLFVIGRYCGVESTTAVSNGAQVMYLFTVIIIGLAMGSTVSIARSVGASDRRQAARTIGNTMTLFALLAVVMAVLLVLNISSIVRLIDTPADAVAGTKDYLFVCFIGIPFIIAYNVLASIFRGLGDSRSPMYFVAIACGVNIVLDFLFIGHLGMGPRGAALATTLSQMASVVFALSAIHRHRNIMDLHRRDLRLHRNTVMAILKTGIPVAMQDGFIQVSFIAITIIANGRGVCDAAAVGIVEKFIGLVFIVPSSMLQVVSAMSAQNIGAGLYDRARQTLSLAVRITFSYGMAAAVLMQFIPGHAVSIFTSDPQVIHHGGQYLQAYAWDCALAGIHFCFSGYFTACGYSFISFCHNFASIILARIPLSFLLSRSYPDTLYPMGLASPLGSLLSIAVCIIVYWQMRKHHFLEKPANTGTSTI